MIPQIIAHRGASYLAPENTLAAFRKAMEIGADGVEMDVQKTLDGGLVIHHDYIIDLHTDISGRIYDMTEGELKDLDFGSWKDVAYKDEKIATLAEALALCRSMEGCAVQLEMKSTMDNDPAFVSGVVDAIRAADIADRLVLISFNHDLLRQAKALMPELRVGVLLYGAFESMVLPPPVIWKDLGLVNGMEDEEAALDEELAALPVDAGMDPDEENGWMTRWVNDKVSMLRANFPGRACKRWQSIWPTSTTRWPMSKAWTLRRSTSAANTTPPTATQASSPSCRPWGSRWPCGPWTRKRLSGACCPWGRTAS